jgi:uncharacterized protein
VKRFSLFGAESGFTDLGRAIFAENLDELERRIAGGLDINEHVPLAGSTADLPLTLALFENKPKAIRFLLDRGAELNDRSSPAIVTAAFNCDAATLELLVARGARIDAVDRVGKNAYSAALYGERYDLLPVLARLGLHPDADGGSSLRQAAFGRQLDAVRFFVEHGVSVNGHVPDMVMPSNPTAVAIAARNGDLPMVRYLVEHGADVLIKDEYGDRPYTHAVALGHAELQAYLRPLEPPAWHDPEQRLAELEPFELPDALIAWLRRDERRIELAADGPIRFVVFHDLLGVKPIAWQRRRFLDLLLSVDDYWEVGFLAWSPRDRKLVHVDFEHDELRVLCTWPQFEAEPAKWIVAALG